MNEETLNFICAITGHNEETIQQMYNDYTSSPRSYSKIETEQQLEAALQTYIQNVVKAVRANTLANSDQLTLGELILKLEPIVKSQKEGEEATVRYDFEYLFPTSIDSWRGSYDELALNFNTEGKKMKVSDFLQMLKNCIGKKFTGYKGGEYIMHKGTPIWVANYSHSGNTAVIDVVDNNYVVILITGYREFKLSRGR